MTKIEDLADFLMLLGHERFLELFKEHEIDSETLVTLNVGDLREMGLLLGPRKKILVALKHYQSSEAQTPESLSRARPGLDAGTRLPVLPTSDSGLLNTNEFGIEGGIKHVSVLFADIKGSTALGDISGQAYFIIY